MQLNDLKKRLNIPQYDNEQDEVLQQLLTAVWSAVETHLGRKLIQAAYAEQYNGNGKAALVLRHYPVVQIDEVHINGQQVQDWRNDDWLLIRDCGFPKGLRNVAVRYTAGYAEMPADLSEAVLVIAMQRVSDWENKGVQSKSLAGETITFASFSQSDGIPPAAFAILERYKRKC